MGDVMPCGCDTSELDDCPHRASAPARLLGAADVPHRFERAEELVRRVIDKYRTIYPGLWENYTLVLLLAIRESGVWISPDALALARDGKLPNLTTVHRALTAVKKDFQRADGKQRSDRMEDEWTAAARDTIPGDAR